MRQQSPPPVQAPRDETAVVEPFTLPPNNYPNPDRKQANGAYPVYDPPTAPPPTVRMEVRPTTPTQVGKTRYNPPAYSEQTKAAGGSSSRPPHTKNVSSDTVSSTRNGPPVHAKNVSADSIPSSRSGGANWVGGGSIAAMASVANPMAPNRTVINAQSSSQQVISNTVPVGHGGNASNDSSLKGKGRPTMDDNFSTRDLA